jgi:hypothetical protein
MALRTVGAFIVLPPGRLLNIIMATDGLALLHDPTSTKRRFYQRRFRGGSISANSDTFIITHAQHLLQESAIGKWLQLLHLAGENARQNAGTKASSLVFIEDDPSRFVG